MSEEIETTGVDASTETIGQKRERHQAMLQSHRDEKQRRRERHNEKKHQRSTPPNTIV